MNSNWFTEWDFQHKYARPLFEEEVQSCKEALSTHLNDELQKGAIKGICIADMNDIHVEKTILRIRFADESNFGVQNIETLRNVVQRCVSYKIPNCSVINGQLKTW